MSALPKRRAGRPTHKDMQRGAEIAPVADRVAATWAETPETESGPYASRLRQALAAHGPELARLFGSGVRLAHVGRALARRGVTVRGGAPLEAGAFSVTWRRVERDLAPSTSGGER